jgi:hypothetical protein
MFSVSYSSVSVKKLGAIGESEIVDNTFAILDDYL